MRANPNRAGRLTLRFAALGYLALLLLIPIVMIFVRTFDDGIGKAFDAITTPEAIHAFYLTFLMVIISVPLNTAFGVLAALVLVRQKFKGKAILNAFIDVPFAISPVVVGLALVLVYNGRDGWFGQALENAGFQVIFASPGMIMATVFVALPLVIREVVPVLEEIGDDQEQAARSLGANAAQTLRRITLPAIKWAVVYGVVLSLARSLGEFGAVKIVSGNIAGQTMTASQQVEDAYQNFQQGTSYAVAALLALIAMACLVVVSFLRPKDED